jgi:Tfp pilus assembly PilM family ATPase
MSLLSALRDTSGPSVAVEIAANRVSAASLSWRNGEAVVAAHATEALPPGALVPALTVANTHDRAAVVAALERVLERVGRPRRIGLVVPDLVAKVSLVRFEQVPSKAQDLDQLVRWQVRKTAPFAIEEAQIAYVKGIRAGAEQEFVVSLARRDVVQEYEALAADAGAHAGIVDLSTFNVINATLAAPPPATLAGGDWLLVNVAPDYASIAILRGPHLIFFRNRAADTDGTLADLVHQTAMYYEDRLNGAGFARVILAGAASAGFEHAGEFDQMRLSLERRLTTPVETIDPRTAAALTDRIVAGPELLDILAPLVGLLLRDRESAA